MEAGMIGADPQVMRDLATKFDEAAERLNCIRSSVEAWVDKTEIWRGMDNHQFVGDWQSIGARSVVDTAAALRNGADILRTNADAQEVASAVNGAGGPAGSGLFNARTGVSGTGGGGGGWGGGTPGNSFDIDMSVPETVHGVVQNSIKALKLGADAIAFVNHRQFTAAAADGNTPLMTMHLMHQIDAKNFSKFMSEAGDAMGHVGNVVTVIGSIGDYVSGSPSERLMAAVHSSTVGLSYLGPIGKGGAAVIGAFESVMPTTLDEQSDVVAYGLNRMYPGTDINNLTHEQAQAIGSRYDGVKGFATMLTDTAGNHAENGVKAVKKFGDAAGDGYSFLRDKLRKD